MKQAISKAVIRTAAITMELRSELLEGCEDANCDLNKMHCVSNRRISEYFAENKRYGIINIFIRRS